MANVNVSLASTGSSVLIPVLKELTDDAVWGNVTAQTTLRYVILTTATTHVNDLMPKLDRRGNDHFLQLERRRKGSDFQVEFTSPKAITIR